MKILQLDKRHGILKIRIETHEDFPILSKFLKKGDLITSKTSRKIKRDGNVYRKTMKVTLSFRDTSYQPFGKRLRVSGVIRKGPEDLVAKGSYHTINLEINDMIILEREDLSAGDLVPLQEAEKYTKRPPILLIAIERGVAAIGRLSSYELRIIRTVNRNVSTKGRGETGSEIHKFFSEVYSILKPHLDETKAIIVAGPGFTKKKFSEYIKEKVTEKNIYTGETSTGTRSGLHEILRRGIPEEVRRDQRISTETRLIEELLKHVGKQDGLAVYGYQEVKKAVKYGAVEKLLISTSKFYSNEFRERIMHLIEETREKGGEFRIVSVQHPSGQQFERMSGIGALLRYSIK